MDLTVKLPRLFAEDHMDRDLPTGELVKINVRTMTFRITDQATFDEWLSDANYYKEAGWMMPDWEIRHSMAKSAKRTIEILKELT